MKVVVFIGGEALPLLYFANSLQKHFEIELLVIEKQKPKNKTSSAPNSRLSFLEKSLNYLSFRLKQKRQNKNRVKSAQELKLYQEELFGQGNIKKPNLAEENILYTESINSEAVIKRLEAIKPDLILDHGTSIVKPVVLALSKLAINLHWGLSPYYRGVMCTNQALYNWDVNNIGVTLHKLSSKIDGGDILSQKRIEIFKEDTIGKITSRLTFYGTELLIKAIEKMKNEENLIFHEQDFSKGFITRGINWNIHLSQFIEDLNEELLAKMIAKPSRGKAPIIKLD